MENNRIKLRAIEPSDIDLIYRWENDTGIWRVSNTITPFSRHILNKYIEDAHLDIYQAKQLRLMIDAREEGSDDCHTVGTIDLFDFDPYHLRAGVGILIGDPHQRRKGYASDALTTLIKYAFDVLGLHQLYCNITSDNETSLHLFRTHGFEITGEKKEWIKTPGGWVDEYFLQCVRKG